MDWLRIYRLSQVVLLDHYQQQLRDPSRSHVSVLPRLRADGIVACSASDALGGIPVMILSGHRHLTNDFNADDPGPRKCWSSFRILSAPMLFDVPA